MRKTHEPIDVIRARLEAQLRREGLAPLPAKNAVSSLFRSMTADQIEAHRVVVDRWQTWAFAALDEFPFRNGGEREAWRFYAEGNRIRQIPGLLSARWCVALRSVERLIAKVKASYPARPANPWIEPRGHAVAEEEPSPGPVHVFSAAERAALEAQMKERN